MKKCRLTGVPALALLLTAGCGAGGNPLALLRGQTHVETSLLPTDDVEATPREESCYLDLVLDRGPERPYVVLGRVTAVWVGADQQALETTEDEVVPYLRQRACQAGGHVLFHIDAHYQDQWVDGASGGAGRGALARTLRATALVGVYVNRNGSPLQPPRGPRRVIRVPAQVDQESGTRAQEADDGMTWDQGIADPWAVPAP